MDTGQVALQARDYPSFCSMKRLGIFLLLPGRNGSPSRGTLGIQFAGTLLYTRVERGTVKCLSQEATQYPRLGLEPGALDPETNALIMWPQESTAFVTSICFYVQCWFC